MSFLYSQYSYEGKVLWIKFITITIIIIIVVIVIVIIIVLISNFHFVYSVDRSETVDYNNLGNSLSCFK